MVGWHRIRVRSEERTYGRISASLGSRLPSNILDLGGSSDLLAERMRDRGHDVVGVDINDVSSARERKSAFLQADLSEGNRADVGTGFDLVLAAHVLEHLPRPGDPFEQIRRVLSLVGTALIWVPSVGHRYSRLRSVLSKFDDDPSSTTTSAEPPVRRTAPSSPAGASAS